MPKLELLSGIDNAEGEGRSREQVRRRGNERRLPKGLRIDGERLLDEDDLPTRKEFIDFLDMLENAGLMRKP